MTMDPFGHVWTYTKSRSTIREHPHMVSSQETQKHKIIDTYVARACNAGWKVTTIVWITFHENASWTLKEVGGTHGGTIGKLTIIGRISVS
jgi:hypothetical protein